MGLGLAEMTVAAAVGSMHASSATVIGSCACARVCFVAAVLFAPGGGRVVQPAPPRVGLRRRRGVGLLLAGARGRLAMRLCAKHQYSCTRTGRTRVPNILCPFLVD